ncbi:hypothetical protein PYW07_008852 [Mythimna separata]|uniref:RING-type domain-containing protein n=1 Tax=Mythimna separata TaxID=271217 RepID=A0AAD7YBB0_MYTSE|nr:hypothetical protein PYW07_008852 [Mythimna separata]
MCKQNDLENRTVGCFRHICKDKRKDRFYLFRYKMNILCTICSDLVNQAENIYVTKCGHIFHHQCLAQWIERSKTCPQCRNKVTDKCMFRLFPTISNENSSEDAATLQSRLDDAQLQLRQQRVKSKEKEDKLAAATADLKRQDDLLKSYERRLVSFDSKVLALREQLEFANAQNKDIQKIKDENEALKKNLQTLNGLQKVLNATSDDVEQMLHSYTDVRTIATFATALKRALCDSEAKKNESRDRLHAAKQQLALEKKNVEIVQDKMHQLELELRAAQEKCLDLKDAQYAELKRLVASTPPPRNNDEDDNSSFTDNATDDSSVDINQERNKKAAWLNVLSPKVTKTNQARTEESEQARFNEFKRKIKAIIRMKHEHRLEQEKRFGTCEKSAADIEMDEMLMEETGLVDRIEKSDSPYLSLQQGSILSLTALQRKPLKLPENAQKSEHGYLNAIKDAKQKRIGEQSNANTKHSIFNKKDIMKMGSLNETVHKSADISYDGLGGHSKPDVFPVPNKNAVQSRIPKVSAKHKLKRPSPNGSQDIEKMLKKVKNN